MKPTIKIAFVFNNTNWLSIEEKVQQVCGFYGSIFEVIPSVFHTSFVNIPFRTVGSIGGIENTQYNTTTVEPDWYSQYITSLCPGADIAILYLNATDDNPPRSSIGIMQGKYKNVVQCCIFGISETDHAYVYKDGIDVDQGNCFVLFAEHEISHALYLIQEIPDNTHTYFYSGQAIKVLDDLKNGKLNKLQLMIAYLKQQILLLTTQINAIKVMPTITMVQKWAVAIKHAEGWYIPGQIVNGKLYPKGSLSFQNNNPGNLKFAPTIAEWGATQGNPGTDGGHFAVFKTSDQGFQALCNFLTLGCKDGLRDFHKARTLIQFTKVFAGNPPQDYINSIVKELGISPDVNISTFL